jgi:hypothetical protein
MNRSSFLLLPLLAPLAPLALSSAARADSMPETMLAWATKLVAELTPDHNVYGSHPTYVEWSDDATGAVARNRSVCSSFASHLLERSFGYTASDIDAWFGKTGPQAREYYETIEARHGFERIVHIAAIRPGDIIAVEYPAGSRPTGHVMIAASRAVARGETSPVEPGTQQYEIVVIDSAHSGHGPDDTRRNADRTWTTGVGRGTLRLYGRPDDTIAGHSWSTTPRSVFRPVAMRKVAVGRLDLARAPHPSGTPGATSGNEDAAPSEDDSDSGDS